MKRTEQGTPSQRVDRLRVVKKLNPADRGAIKLAEQFGKTLICVRHRVDAEARYRFTTVELLVGKTIIKPRSDKLVAVKVSWGEHSLREIVRAAGARWDRNAKVWRMPRRLAGILRLSDRIERP